MKATRITALVALLVMAGGVKMHGQEASEIKAIFSATESDQDSGKLYDFEEMMTA